MRYYTVSYAILMMAFIWAVSFNPGDCLGKQISSQNLRVGTWNLNWFFDEDGSDNSASIGRRFASSSATAFDQRVGRIAEVIDDLNLDVIVLQEVENQSVLRRLALELEVAHGQHFNVAFVQGRDTHTGQDVGFLVRDDWSAKAQRFVFSCRGQEDFKDLSKHGYVDIEIAGETLRVINVHLSSRLSPRKRQAKTLRSWIDIPMDQVDHLIVLGDFNTGLRHTSTAPGTDMGTILGLDTSSTADDLVDLHRTLSANDRITHAGGLELDRILITGSLVDGNRTDFASLENKRAAAGNLSDHYPLVAKFVITP
ncbi:MAG: hypothetical protein Aurels2KO_54890 [Aureliella sp.]